MSLPKFAVDCGIHGWVSLQIVENKKTDGVRFCSVAQVIVIIGDELFSRIHNVSYCTRYLNCSRTRPVLLECTESLTRFCDYRRRIRYSGCVAGSSYDG